MSDRHINLLVALPAEAKPLIRAFDLQRQQPDGAYPRYLSSHLSLTLTGAGAEAMRRGVEFLLSQQTATSTTWLNVGIAGHGTLPRGTCLLAEKVIDMDSGRNWALSASTDAVLPKYPLHCVSEAESTYAENTAYDMESSGFVAGLESAGVLDRGQILKVVSDNPRQPSTQINGRMVGDLIQQAIPVLSSLMDRLHSHAE
ncbi:MAG: hypothetical protein KZQ93_04545 [Candidatus Thiodiazotropha sp. (ex Monitilora ramsayi)]|nr:hypothetical protein [Candidatus Thiodiazotropha sp. (ex Monitilora ramsayi)]